MKWGEFKVAVEEHGIKDEDSIKLIDAGTIDDFDSMECLKDEEEGWIIYGT